MKKITLGVIKQKITNDVMKWIEARDDMEDFYVFIKADGTKQTYLCPDITDTTRTGQVKPTARIKLLRAPAQLEHQRNPPTNPPPYAPELIMDAVIAIKSGITYDVVIDWWGRGMAVEYPSLKQPVKDAFVQTWENIGDVQIAQVESALNNTDIQGDIYKARYWSAIDTLSNKLRDELAKLGAKFYRFDIIKKTIQMHRLPTQADYSYGKPKESYMEKPGLYAGKKLGLRKNYDIYPTTTRQAMKMFPDFIIKVSEKPPGELIAKKPEVIYIAQAYWKADNTPVLPPSYLHEDEPAFGLGQTPAEALYWLSCYLTRSLKFVEHKQIPVLIAPRALLAHNVAKLAQQACQYPSITAFYDAIENEAVESLPATFKNTGDTRKHLDEWAQAAGWEDFSTFWKKAKPFCRKAEWKVEKYE